MCFGFAICSNDQKTFNNACSKVCTRLSECASCTESLTKLTLAYFSVETDNNAKTDNRWVAYGRYLEVLEVSVMFVMETGSTHAWAFGIPRLELDRSLLGDKARTFIRLKLMTQRKIAYSYQLCSTALAYSPMDKLQIESKNLH